MYVYIYISKNIYQNPLKPHILLFLCPSKPPHFSSGLRQADLLRLGPGQGRPGGGMPGFERPAVQISPRIGFSKGLFPLKSPIKPPIYIIYNL